MALGQPLVAGSWRGIVPLCYCINNNRSKNNNKKNKSWAKPLSWHGGNAVHYERRRPEDTVLYRLIQEHAESFFAQVEVKSGAGLPEFVKEEFDAFLECGLLAHGFLRLRCDQCAHEKLAAFSCKRRGFCPSCGARRMVESAAHMVEHVIPHVPVRQWVLSLPIPLRILLAAQPQLLTPLLRLIHWLPD